MSRGGGAHSVLLLLTFCCPKRIATDIAAMSVVQLLALLLGNCFNDIIAFLGQFQTL